MLCYNWIELTFCSLIPWWACQKTVGGGEWANSWTIEFQGTSRTQRQSNRNKKWKYIFTSYPFYSSSFSPFPFYSTAFCSTSFYLLSFLLLFFQLLSFLLHFFLLLFLLFIFFYSSSFYSSSPYVLSSYSSTFYQCSGSMTFWGGSGSGSSDPWLTNGSGSCYFRHLPSRCQQKTNF